MPSKSIKALAAFLVLSPANALAVTAPKYTPPPPTRPAPPTVKPFYSSHTSFTVLLNNPDTAAVWKTAFPTLPYDNATILSQAGTMSPRDVSFMAPAILSDAALKKLDDALAKIPAPKPDVAAAAPAPVADSPPVLATAPVSNVPAQ